MNTALMTRPAQTEEVASDVPAAIFNDQPVPSVLAKLSPTELRVALLVADGLTNRQIGERLFVSHRTIDTHISHLFNKLNVNSRVRLALVVGA